MDLSSLIGMIYYGIEYIAYYAIEAVLYLITKPLEYIAEHFILSFIFIITLPVIIKLLKTTLLTLAKIMWN